MVKVFIAPRRYVQGAGVLKDIGKYVAPLGKRVLVAWGPVVSEQFSSTVKKSFEENDLVLVPFKFSGECDRGQIGRGVEKAKTENAEVVVGLGGGKAIDLAKAVAMEIDAKLVTAPTIASNDAPTSAATVYYTEEGNFDGWGIWPRNPDLVLVDTQVIVEAPVRWLISGIGDGLATWFEAEAAYKGRRVALAGGVATQAALTLARLCYDTLMDFGVDAVRDSAEQVVTPAVDRVIEANTLLSGLGFESAGVAAAQTGMAIGVFKSTTTTSASLPASNDPISSAMPNAAAPPRQAIHKTSSGNRTIASRVFTLCRSAVVFSTSNMSWRLLLPGPSLPKATVMPRARISGTRATPDARYILLTGQWTTTAL